MRRAGLGVGSVGRPRPGVLWLPGDPRPPSTGLRACRRGHKYGGCPARRHGREMAGRDSRPTRGPVRRTGLLLRRIPPRSFPVQRVPHEPRQLFARKRFPKQRHVRSLQFVLKIGTFLQKSFTTFVLQQILGDFSCLETYFLSKTQNLTTHFTSFQVMQILV